MSVEKMTADTPFSEKHVELVAAEVELTPEEERRLKRKIDWAIIPYCTLLYLLSESLATSTPLEYS
jgi:hypothetical protein